MKKYKFGILLAATSDSHFTLGTMIVNLKDKMQDYIEVFYVISNELSLEYKQSICKVAGNSAVVFLKFTYEDFINNLKNSSQTPIKLHSNNSFLNRWTYMAYACFEAFKYLEECECIVYLDFDILVLKPFEEFANLRNKGYVLAARKGKTSIKHTLKAYKGEFAQECVYQTPIIVFNDTLKNPLKYYHFIYSFSTENPLNINDQGVFSLLCFKEKLLVFDLKNKYTGSVCWIKNDNPSMIHAYGKNNRFWNNELCNRIWKEWNEYYRIWLDNGGGKYQGGITTKTTYGYERIRLHLEYKLGYAMIECSKNLQGYLKFIFVVVNIIKQHKQALREYKAKVKAHKHLSLPTLKTYQDYAIALQEKQSIPYRLGSILEFLNSFSKLELFIAK
ncbi:glycosyltransferase [Helicobacter mesocricetorum]|uniref:glycosyltransferase n=1 Tax=Helicobacter mesocricetorum TaxID=87012 RepID=UPI000CF17728|nr:glycosyltransferase [Helicobacter mesocricetorum]